MRCTALPPFFLLCPRNKAHKTCRSSCARSAKKSSTPLYIRYIHIHMYTFSRERARAFISALHLERASERAHIHVRIQICTRSGRKIRFLLICNVKTRSRAFISALSLYHSARIYGALVCTSVLMAFRNWIPADANFRPLGVVCITYICVYLSPRLSRI